MKNDSSYCVTIEAMPSLPASIIIISLEGCLDLSDDFS